MLHRLVVDRIMSTFPTDIQKFKYFLVCSYKRQSFQSDDIRKNLDYIEEFFSRYYGTSDLKVLDKYKSTTEEPMET